MFEVTIKDNILIIETKELAPAVIYFLRDVYIKELSFYTYYILDEERNLSEFERMEINNWLFMSLMTFTKSELELKTNDTGKVIIKESTKGDIIKNIYRNSTLTLSNIPNRYYKLGANETNAVISMVVSKESDDPPEMKLSIVLPVNLTDNGIEIIKDKIARVVLDKYIRIFTNMRITKVKIIEKYINESENIAPRYIGSLYRLDTDETLNAEYKLKYMNLLYATSISCIPIKTISKLDKCISYNPNSIYSEHYILDRISMLRFIKEPQDEKIIIKNNYNRMNLMSEDIHKDLKRNILVAVFPENSRFHMECDIKARTGLYGLNYCPAIFEYNIQDFLCAVEPLSYYDSDYIINKSKEELINLLIELRDAF